MCRIQFSSDSRNDDAEFWEHDDSRPGVDLFLQNVKLQGEAVRKSGKRLAASVLVKKEGRSEQTRQVTLLSERVVSLQGENQPGQEFHLKVSVGEIVIVEVTKCTRDERETFEPEFHVGGVSLLRATEPCEAFP